MREDLMEKRRQAARLFDEVLSERGVSAELSIPLATSCKCLHRINRCFAGIGTYTASLLGVCMV